MTIGEGAAYARRKLEPLGSGHEAWRIIEHITGMKLEKLVAGRDAPLTEEQLSELARLLALRLEGRPLQYIIGKWEFMGLTLALSKDVLIPRQDTEVLAELALQTAKLTGARTALDMCTGSGCVAIALAKLGGLKVTAADVSADALKNAIKNAVNNGVKLNAVQSDLFVNIKGVFDLVTCNPPYIPSGEIKDLMPEVRDYEPLLALDGGKDGLDFYRRIVKDAQPHLRPGGRLMLEVGQGQFEAVMELLDAEGWINTGYKKDYSGIERVVYAERQNKRTRQKPQQPADRA